jgi:hypothetical protein
LNLEYDVENKEIIKEIETDMNLIIGSFNW